MTKKKAVFFDKDGTLVVDRPYNVDPGLMELMPDAGLALGRLARAGYALFVVSNQPGVELGRFREAQLEGVWRYLDEAARREGAPGFEGFYFCPHLPLQAKPDCECRKPRPGLLLRAAREHGIDLERSWMVGDILNDVEAGKRAGCRAILLDSGGETEWALGPDREADAIVRTLGEVVDVILSKEGG
jgi:histidinol-phosphate phosphatase family protein